MVSVVCGMVVLPFACVRLPSSRDRGCAIGPYSPVCHFSRHRTFRIIKRTHHRERSHAVGISDTYLTDTSLQDQLRSAVGPDLFLLDLAEKLEESVVSQDDTCATAALTRLREQSAENLVRSRWPTPKLEAYRFTDLRFLKKSKIKPSLPASEGLSIDLPGVVSTEGKDIRLVFVDGVLSNSLSNFNELPHGVFVGSISNLSDDKLRDQILSKLGCSLQWTSDDVFYSLNGVGVQDVGIVFVPDGLKLETPIHVVYYSSQSGDENGQTYVISCPRLLVNVGKRAQLHIIEEFVGLSGKVYWSNSALELWISEDGEVSHNYIQCHGRQAIHTKQTFVAQSEASSYKLVEAGVGGSLSRHNLHVEQLGAETFTEISSSLLAGQNQIQDLHSRFILNHPRGYGRQLHKCIVMHSSGHCVFDGNVKVNRYAQQTDAGQLSRSLLLATRATVNVKPNLQIIADDVKCSHGATISDLEEEQLFYFRARGIDPQTARSALVFSFVAEVLEKLQYKNLRTRIENLVKVFLAAEGDFHSSI